MHARKTNTRTHNYTSRDLQNKNNECADILSD